MEKIRIHHPDLDGEVTIFASALPFHAASGWRRVEADPSEVIETAVPPVIETPEPNVDTGKSLRPKRT